MRLAKIQFLEKCGIEFDSLLELPQDASSKIYHRVVRRQSPKSLILMHYPDEQDKFFKFILIAEVFIKNGLLAPKIWSHDPLQCFALLEDFGEATISKYIQHHQHERLALYQKIIDTMLTMQRLDILGEEGSISNCNQQQAFSKEILLKELKITTKWYFPYIGLQKNTEEAIIEYFEIWSRILDKLPQLGNVFVHRDFHVDNLFIVPHGTNSTKIGMIDFQDYIFGSPIYDLVSLLDDARIEVTPQLRDQLIEYYSDFATFSQTDIWRAYHILGAQRNSRILGVFAQKAMNGNPNYTKFIPRVKNYLQQNLSSLEDLKELRQWMKKNLSN